MAPQTAYRSLEPDEQVIIVDEARPDLDELARWETIPVSEAKAILKRRGATTAPDTTPDVPKTAAEKKAADAAAKAEVERIAALPVHTGDTVKLTEAYLAAIVPAGGATPEAVAETATAAAAWRGLVTDVHRDDETDADVAEFEAGSTAVPLDSLEVVTAE